MKKALSLALLALVSLPLQAHYVWLERDQENAARVYFGEWENDRAEKTGERLDTIRAEVILPEGAARGFSRQVDHVAVQLRHKGDLGLVEEMAPRQARNSEVVSRTVYLARAGRSESKALLELDLVPETPGSNRFTLMFRGEPLPRASINLFGPPKWQRSLRSDRDGKVSIDTPWQGQYVIEVAHLDEQAGKVDGQAYEQTRYVLSVSFRQGDGIAWK